MNTKRHTRGAALIVALAILVVLLALAITFLTTSRLELQVATNVEEQLRTELLANGGLAIAIAFLQHDLITHPTYTSLDHAWKTYFNGAWAAGKPWMFPDGRRLWNTFGDDLDGDGNPDPRGPGIPIVSLTNLALNLPQSPDSRPLYGTENTNDWLYLPVVMDNPAALFPAVERNISGIHQFDRRTNGFFVISEQVARNPAALGPNIPPFVDPIENTPRPRLASELTDIWADVDNTGDGVKDAMWIPVPQDVDFSNDGIDNDLSGVIDNPGEIARFLYWDPTMQVGGSEVRGRMMLTAPLVANGLPVVVIPDVREAGAVDIGRLQQRYAIPDADLQVLLADDSRWAVLSNYGHPSVDRRDNDHDFIEGNARTIDLRNEIDPANPTAVGAALFAGANPFDFADFRDLFPINPRYTQNIGPNPFVDGAGNELPFIYSSGEPVTEIVGRLAITINDAASRVDVGAVGGFAREASLFTDVGPFNRVRSIGEGVSPFEYEPRVLPAFGPARTEKLWNLTVGAPYGLTNEFLPAGQPLYDSQYEFDVRHPGYGLVDDNANALSLAMDGVDNDGTGLVDPVLRLSTPLDPIEVRRRYYAAFGQPLHFEGVDEPGEYRRFRPHRNRFAESDGVDNNPPIEFGFSNGDVIGWSVDPNRPQIVDEVGELGDLVLRSKEQIKQIVENENFLSGQRLHDIVRNLTTVHATQRTERRRFTNAFGQNQLPDSSVVPERGDITGTRLDLNYASVEQIFDALTEDFGYPSLYEEFLASLNRADAPRRENFPDDNSHRRAQLRFMQNTVQLPLFALGLGVSGLNMNNTPLDRIYSVSPTAIVTNAWAADERLRAAQMAVNIADFRDADHNRTTFTFTVPDLWWELEQRERNVPEDAIQAREIEYTVAGIESIRINELMVRPSRRVEAEMLYGIRDTVFPDIEAQTNVNALGNLYRPTSPYYLRHFQTGIPETDATFIQGGNYDVLFDPTGIALPDNIQRPTYIFRNYDPNYFSIFSEFPDFRMTQRFFAWWDPTELPGALDVDADGNPIFTNNLPEDVYNPVQLPITTQIPGVAEPLTATAEHGWERIWSKMRTMGSDTALFTQLDEITRVNPDTGVSATGPNFAEFEFLPSPGLPPGRYYLKINTAMLTTASGPVRPGTINTIDGRVPATRDDPSARLTETVRTNDDIRIFIKYDLPGRGFVADVAEGGQGFFDNVMNDANAQVPVTWRELTIGGNGITYPAQAGIPGFLGAKSTRDQFLQGDGTIFVPFTDEHFAEHAGPVLANLIGSDLDVNPLDYDPQGSHTITIPAYTDGLALHVAVWKGPGLSESDYLAVNYFEFSQEPAHEWVEIVNIAEDAEPIDLSGWVLEVGHPEDEGFVIQEAGNPVVFDPLRRRFRVPDGTQIVPGGKLLLGFSKFDFLGATGAVADDLPGINKNGMGLANSGFLLDLLAGPDPFVPGLNLAETSVPPIPMGDPRFANDLWPMGPPIGVGGTLVAGFPAPFADTGSVFRRVLFDPDSGAPIPATFRDFVDDTGDGLDDLLSGRVQLSQDISGALLASTDSAGFQFDRAVRPEELGAAYRFSSTPFDSTPFDQAGDVRNKAYDRIVQMEPIDGTESILPIFGTGLTPQAIARTILTGGVFPHYPERDGRDNDMDGTRTFHPLLNDYIDNNLGELTGGFEGDLVNLTEPSFFVGPIDDAVRWLGPNGGTVYWPSEGVDEGAPGRQLVAGEFGNHPGAFSDLPLPYFLRFPGSPQPFQGPPPLGSPQNLVHKLHGGAPPIGGANHAPEFKAFLERRWNPGDAIKVTLYTGRPSEERVADRVTYSERDVVNRSIHDGIACPYQRVTLGAQNLATNEWVFNGIESQSLDPRHPTMWPDDTMGVDFYRSLERRHPLYTGDLYGTGNRWTATDGNYNDWDAGWGKKDANLRVDPVTGFYQDLNGQFVSTPQESSWIPNSGLELFWSGFVFEPGSLPNNQPAIVRARQDVLIGHQLEASPLRKNFAARTFENPVTPRAGGLPLGFGPVSEGGRQFQFSNIPDHAPRTRDPYALQRPAISGGFDRNALKRWTWHKPRVRNASLASVGDLMTLPDMVVHRRFWSGARLSGVQTQPGSLFTISSPGNEPYGTYDETVRSVFVAEERRKDLSALASISLMEPKVLTAGQANVYFLTGGPTGTEPSSFQPFDVVRGDDTGVDIGPGGDDISWPSGTVFTGPGSFPSAWTPVFVHNLPGDGLMEVAPAGPNQQVLAQVPENALMHITRTGPDVDFFLGNQLQGTGVTIADLQARSSLRSRVAFWVSGNLPGVDRNQLATGGVSEQPAEVLFEWTGDAGLENGDYEVYIVTAEPLDGLARYANIVLNNDFPIDPSVFPLPGASNPDDWRINVQRRLAEALTPTALAILQQDAGTDPSSLPVDVEILTDRDGNRRVWGNPIGGPQPTDFREGGAVDGEAINPQSAGLLKRVTPDSQGVIHYGQVRVENNYLALRLRNWAQPGRLNRFSRVVLTPVNRVRGRININTVATVRDTNDLGNRPGPVLGFETSLLPDSDGVPRLELPLFNPLQGLPGVLTASYDEEGFPSALELLRRNDSAVRNIDSINVLGFGDPRVNMYDRSISMADRIVQHRPDWGDGRYYRFPSDMVSWSQLVPWQPPSTRNVPYANEFPHFPSEALASMSIEDAFVDTFTFDDALVDARINRATLFWIDPERGVNEYGFQPAAINPIEQYNLNNARFQETAYRFSRMANNVTTRSDVFEIVVTAQSGYVPVTGERGQGAINYRNEFVVQGEQKIRVVYER